MEITKKTIKALASDTRLDILKILAQRKRIAADLAKDLKLAPSTVNEHLKKLEESELIRKKDSGHKWFYYEITDKGLNLIKPKAPVQFILMLSIGAIMMLIGGAYSLSYSFGQEVTSRLMEKAPLVAEGAAQATDSAGTLSASGGDSGIVFIILFVIGLVLAILAIYKIMKR